MRKSLQPAFFFTLFISGVNAQMPSATLELSNARADFDQKGLLFSTYSGIIQRGFEYPKGSTNHTIFSASYWVSAIDSANNTLSVSAQTYPQINDAFFAGPTRNPPYNDLSRNGIVRVTKDIIMDFQSNFGSPGYIIPSPIINWEGNGNVQSGMTEKLAPFIDLNSNDIYEPISWGDYPFALGEENLFFICNDASGSRSGFNNITPSIGIEIENYVYDLEAEHTEFANCVFINTIVRNTSSSYLKDIYLGLWFDFDIGDGSDDLIGCDSSRNLFFAYNADLSDVDYGTNIPAQAVMLLNDTLHSFIGYNNSSDPVNGNPTNPIQIANLLRGRWKDGSSIRNTGNGTGTNGNATKFLHDFTVNQESGPGADRRALGSIGPFSLSPGKSKCLDFVVFPAEDFSNNTPLNNVLKVIERSDSLQVLFETFGIGCSSPLIANLNSDIEDLSALTKVFPNPTKGLFYIQNESKTGNFSVLIRDISTGKVIFSFMGEGEIQLKIPTDSLKPGLYIVSVFIDGNVTTNKIVVYE